MIFAKGETELQKIYQDIMIAFTGGYISQI
ncbi:hypothetical protein SAMN05421821_106275 [Mucilaginibacter lappiensis]|uniref:Uncharacterized protein n=1 Tax=Mucilaginibacter lappiensis TaxID=354630 RepID=A0ABR6PL31_9SPHI|nr:hypothetical protein [Mucilaginibacter lappiensis]SIR35097.1 hypothetical protein SAMN05421821_106275 [Mucilaginibacter lappiensis]